MTPKQAKILEDALEKRFKYRYDIMVDPARNGIRIDTEKKMPESSIVFSDDEILQAGSNVVEMIAREIELDFAEQLSKLEEEIEEENK